MKKKKIGLLVPSLNGGGAERVVSRLSYLLSDKYDIYLILFEDTYMKYKYRGTLINLDIKALSHKNILKIFLPFRRAKKLRAIKKNEQLDIVISFLDSPNIVNILSSYSACKTVISIRNYEYRPVLFKWLRKYLYKKASFIVPVSKLIRDDYITKYKIDKNKLKTIYNPYDIDQINNLKKEELPSKYNDFFKSGFIFTSMGRNSYQKGFWHLIKAFKMVHDFHPEAKLVIIGRDEMGGKAKKLVKELNIEKNVLFTGFQKNPFKYLEHSDIYVLSSLFEGFPNALVEAMACGCPVIATDIKSGPREILYKEINLSDNCLSQEKADYGMLVPSFNSEENWESNIFNKEERELSKSMLFFIENKEVREFYRKKSIERAQHFNFEKCKTEFIELIEKL